MAVKFVRSLRFFTVQPFLSQSFRYFAGEVASAASAIQSPLAAPIRNSNNIPTKKSTKNRRKRSVTASYRPVENDELVADAIAYAEEYDLIAISNDKKLNMKYQITLVDDVVGTAIHIMPYSVTSTNRGSNDVREFFIFSDGVIVYWNIETNEQNQISDDLSKYATNLHPSQLCHEEMETMPFRAGPKTTLKKGVIHLHYDSFGRDDGGMRLEEDGGFLSSAAILERFSYSHALATSAKIGMWENQLSEQAEPLSVTADALTNGKILWKRKQALKKLGELAQLRHSINMTELLDTDFYWDRPELEKHYVSLSQYLTIHHRLNMMNKRLDYCQQLVNTIDNTLTHRHASMLEWLIIVLIMIEIIFDTLHFFFPTKPSHRPTREVQE